jgi:hypothetical protein
LVRSRRTGILERFVLAPIPVIRPFRCPNCQYRALRITRRPSRSSLLLFLITILIGVLLVQTLLYVAHRARDYPGEGYQPKDLERAEYLEKKRKHTDPLPD